MAKNKAGGNSRKIGRNKDKPWKRRYDFELMHDKNKRLNIERAGRDKVRAQKKWERRLKKHKPPRGYARSLRRNGLRVAV